MIGFRIANVERAVSPEVIEKFRSLPVANISDCMSRMTSFGPQIRPLHGNGVLAGAAFTVKTRPGDNLMIHKALDMAQPGDVLVVDAGGDLSNSLLGELMLSYAIKRKLAGVVINGAVRDLGWIKERDFPVFAAGVNHRGPYKDGPGEINFPVSINGSVVNPGDLIVGDEDGVVAVGLDELETVYTAASKKHAAETKQYEAIEAGKNDRSWVNEALLQRGVSLPEAFERKLVSF